MATPVDPAPTHGPGAPTARGAGPLLAVVVVVVVVLGALVVWRRPKAAEEVVVIGDSVTYASSPAIHERLDGRATVQIKSMPGYRTSDLVDLFRVLIDERVASGRPLDRAVVLAGYNDITREDARSAGLPKMMAQADRFDCAVWLTLPARPGGEPSATPDLTPKAVDAWNARVREVVADHPHVHVSDEWARVVEETPAADLLQADGLHPVRAGHLALAEAMGRALTAECGG